MAHLLLIDDDTELIPAQVRKAFPAPMHHVEVARTGAAGLDRVRASPPDVILLTASPMPRYWLRWYHDRLAAMVPHGK